ncbi:probable glutathione S-transferase GSTF1 [Hordeum vulgare subsp. vulgare]|uniref:glutathione transferase n=1 Tax=Hordeum vulgare subsp. vulgare TaxID=112509 RepID=A0A8I6XU86_HORVV|nr:probable glutathione S-transferase GSTF1 [Hordeum vulgare subsp. vulgare]
MAAVKVFGSAAFTNVTRVLVCLEEVGAEYEIVQVDFHAREHKGSGHLARNPFGQVPAFQDGDLVLFQSRAISRYVLRKHKTDEVNLLREGDPEESALVDVWMDVEALNFDTAMHAVFYQHRVAPALGRTADEKIIGDNIEKLKKVLDVYEARLTKHRYLAGDFLSLADLSHFPETHYFMGMPYAAVLDAYPRVRAWLKELFARPAVKKVISLMAKDFQ